MTLLDFTKKLNTITEKSALKEAIVTFVNSAPIATDATETNKTRAFIETIANDEFTSFGQNLGFCRNYCLEELNKEENRNDIKYIQKITHIKEILDTISKIYQKVIERRDVNKNKCEEPYTLEQQRGVLRELVDETKNLKSNLDKANKEIEEANRSLDGKMFSLLTNTVAILGIFVAIAFTGLGTVSIFSNIDLKTSIESTEAFIKNVFFMLLASTMAYNLLILLVYFIFKLSRPINIAFGRGVLNKTFRETISLKRFFLVDGILAFLTVGAFTASLFVK